MSDIHNEVVQLSYRHTEKEYLAAIRLYYWNTKELMARLIVIYVLFGVGLLLVNSLLDLVLPPWALIVVMVAVCFGWAHGYLIDLPRRHFRGDPRFREDYNLTFTDGGVEFKSQNMNGTLAWSFYTKVIENDSFYLLVYGKNIHALSVIPKRAFRDAQQETTFRQMLRRNVDHTLKISDGERETKKYVPKSLEPPDWR